MIHERRALRAPANGAVDMKSLLVPVDGSPNADRALAHAVKMARAVQGMKIILLNVQEQLERWYPHGLASDSSREHLKQLGQTQSASARRLLEESGCPYEFLIMFGRTAETIVQVARDHGCSGIVMGTRGLSDLENVFLGSTSFKVVHLSEVPVTLVK
jgi:nucleotide-binding universal stress UspA family protein